MYPRPMTGGFGINAGTGIVYPPAPSSGFEFGADDALVDTLLPGGFAMELLTPTKVRGTIEASNVTEAQMQANTVLPPAAGMLVIPAGSTDIVAYELDLTLPDLSATTFDGTVYTTFVLTDQNGNQYSPIVWWTTPAGQWSIGDISANNAVIGNGGNYRVAVDVDFDTDLMTLRAGANTVAYTGVYPAPPAAEAIPAAQFYTFVTAAGTGLGLDVDVEIIQEAADFTETHVGGTTALADALVVKA